MKRYASDTEKATLNQASALDPRFKALPFLSNDEKEETFAKMVSEAAAIKELEGNVVRQDQEKFKDDYAPDEEKTQTEVDKDCQPPHLPKEEYPPVHWLHYLGTLLQKLGRHHLRGHSLKVQRRRCKGTEKLILCHCLKAR